MRILINKEFGGGAFLSKVERDPATGKPCLEMGRAAEFTPKQAEEAQNSMAELFPRYSVTLVHS